ncbi:cellulose-binding domain-containing protein [Sphaerimonospora thailandensis]|uniref:cellulose-binding domain-containing protein n=1 Tax=Sphaerimonospora thailandensis TaxID=795644 RepID=UPI001EF39CA3|nr:cellulose-binding domain-containing protein [Sphaerimonospora thailandensis]
MTYTVHGSWPQGFTTQVTLKNTGRKAIDGWSLKWSFLGGQKVVHDWNASLTQQGATVTAANAHHNKKIKPGHSVTFGFNGVSAPGANPTPDLFLLNGAACA